MARFLLIANPAASGFTGGLHRDVVRILRAGHDVEAVWPTASGQVEDLADEAVAKGFDMVIAFGGDGIVHHVACRLRGTGTPMGIIPAGTTNVLARILDLPLKPRAAARYLADDPEIRLVSTARLEGWGRAFQLDSCATFAAGLGLDADVVALAEQEPYRKYRFGAVHYARTAATVVWTGYRKRPATLRISDGGRVAFGIAVLTQVHRPYTYFGRIPLTFGSSNGLSVLILEELRLTRLPSLLMRAMRSRDVSRVKGVTVWNELSSLQVEADPPVGLQADGELIGLISELSLTHQPDDLLVTAGRI